MEENANPLLEALRSVFAPIVKQSNKWPPVLAYGLPGVIAVLLIVILRDSLPANLFWLVVVVIVLPMLGFIISDWDARHQVTILKGNVLYEDGRPVDHAAVSVDGIDRGKKETDENGYFLIEVDRLDKWTVRARHPTGAGEAIVLKKGAKLPIRVVLKSQNTSEMLPESAAPSRSSNPQPAAHESKMHTKVAVNEREQRSLANVGATPGGMEATIDRIQLRDALVNSFSEEDLVSLCLDIEQDLRQDNVGYPLDLEIVGGVGKEGKVVALIKYLENRGILHYLIGAARRRRPGLL